MKTIPVPEDITLKDAMTEAPGMTVSFQAWAFSRWMNDPSAADSLVKLQRWLGVIAKFKAITGPGHLLELEDEDHATLAPIVEKAATAEPPLTAVQLLPFAHAVLKA